MRTETYFASAALVRDLDRAGSIAHVHHDGGDIIHIELRTGEHAWVHLIESSIPLAEVVGTLNANRDKALHTLFLFWTDRMLPPHLHHHVPEEWMRPLLSLHGDLLYGYEVHGRDMTIYPVHFEGKGSVRHVRYGDPIEAHRLTCHRRHFNTLELEGEMLWADFGQSASAGQPNTARREAHPLEAFYHTLGLAVGADRRAIKRAYRLMAREAHPDLNADPAATARMQAINEAYARIMRSLGDS